MSSVISLRANRRDESAERQLRVDLAAASLRAGPARSLEIGHRAAAVAGRRAGGGGACLATVVLGPTDGGLRSQPDRQ